MFDEYDQPQPFFSLIIKYVKNRYTDNLDLDIIESIKKCMDLKPDNGITKIIYERLYNETQYRTEVIEKIKTLLHTLDAMDSRHITNIGARVYIGDEIWIGVQVWRREPSCY
jgi:tyrosine-protein phosphatase YwqE